MAPPGRASTRRPGWRMVATPMFGFIAAGTLAVVVVGVALSIASRRVGEREAIVEARSEAMVKGQGLVEPHLSDALLDGSEEAIDTVDDIVRSDVLDDSLIRVKIWSPDGEILYSDDEAQIGQTFPLDEGQVAALEQGLVDAEVSDLSKSENVSEREQGKLLEVYLPVTTPDGEDLLFESYFRYDAVEESGTRLWRSFAPIAIGALVMLELIQIPLALSLARRLRARQLEREELLERAVRSSEHERRRLAQDLHDGVVQDLAGVSYSLAALGRTGGQPDPAIIASAGDTVRGSVEALRTLLVELYPPALEEEGLGPALDDLLARVRANGVETHLDLPAELDLPLPTTRLLYRTAQEALRNVVTHAQASAVSVRAGRLDGVAWLQVADDGTGFDVEAARARAAGGHVGLLGLTDLAADAGGTLQISSPDGRGTTVRLEVPVP